MASRRQGRTQLSRIAEGSFCDSASTRRVQRLSSNGVDLTYTQGYPHVWIARNAFHDRTIGAGMPAHQDRHLTRTEKRKPNVNTRAENVASGFMKLTRCARVPTLCRFESRKGSAPS